MSIRSKSNSFRLLGIAYWFLLLYISAGFIWWYISLEKQNKQMFLFRQELLMKDDPLYADKITALEDAKRRKTWQYIGEGGTFLLVIMAGAVVVYRVGRRAIQLSLQQQNFMMAVTHELKTPIAVIRLNLETMLKRKLNEEQQHKLLTTTLEETGRLNILTNNILTISQLETGAYHLNKQEISLTGIIENSITSFRKRFPDRHIHYQEKEELFVNGEPQLLELLFNNLLDNARKYAPKDRPITIDLTSQNEKALLHVADEGKGISDEEKKFIFNKFYRIGNENTRSSKGTGLGLFLCKKIVKDHHGRIQVKDNKPTGTVFEIELPLA